MAPTAIDSEAPKRVPSSAADAILKASAPLPEGSHEVRGIEFDDFKGKDITVSQLVAGMARMGFQASAVSDAVRIIKGMVGICSHVVSTCRC